MKKIILTIAALLSMTTIAYAVPTLQLDIAGGVYNDSPGIETIQATSNHFTLYAYLKADCANPLSDTYYISGALTPTPTTNVGSFGFNGTTYSQTSGMQLGTPPIEASLDREAKDLQLHGIFPAYFFEVSFQFTEANKLTAYNTQDMRYVNPLTSSPYSVGNTAMYYIAFDVDISSLVLGNGLHFDLYNLKRKSTDPLNYVITEFAPFSHDAEGWMQNPPPPPVPEPGTMLLLGAGLLGLAAYGRKRNRQ